jgi:hypothetical protein
MDDPVHWTFASEVRGTSRETIHLDENGLLVEVQPPDSREVPFAALNPVSREQGTLLQGLADKSAAV